MSEAPQVQVSRIGTETMQIPIRGMAPLLMHKFSEKAKKQMLDAMQGRKNPKVAKDPQAEFEAAAYRMDDDGYGFPSVGFKSCTVSAARFFDKSVTMTLLRQALFFGGEFSRVEGQQMVRINGADPICREDVVRVGQGGSDLRYRPEFRDWTATLEVTYVASLLDQGSVLSLIEAGGLGVGIGDWRPERKGDFGTFALDDTREVTVL